MQLIGIYSKNREEWIYVDCASFLYGLTIVPLYETLDKSSISYCINHSGFSSIFADTKGVDTLLSIADIGRVKYIITFDDIT